MKSLFRCPLCAAPLEREETRWFCPNRHSFDRASAGYVHLLPANQKHSRDPGDDKAMVAARSSFLEKEHYAPSLSCWTAAAGRATTPPACFKLWSRPDTHPGPLELICPEPPCAGPPSAFRRENLR